MSEQPRALQLADELEQVNRGYEPVTEAAAELRRLLSESLRIEGIAYQQHTELYGLRLQVMNLQKANQKQLNALYWIADRCPLMLMEQPLHGIHKEMAHDAGACARAAISEAGEQK